MSEINNVTHHTMVKYDSTCANQVQVRTLKNGDLFAVFNQERYPIHHDTGQTVTTRSKDGGITWSEPKVVVPWTQTRGSWDCGVCELHDGTLIINFNFCGFFLKKELNLNNHLGLQVPSQGNGEIGLGHTGHWDG
ncbi:MAG: hypothetical protein CM1200mP30_17210 [Pseudomonadota bacterium]|nr:MAG: hypothetical protein CM1200mP30_17210 [Pseudomonadota bacterium]